MPKKSYNIGPGCKSRDKRSCLFCPFVSDEEKKVFITLTSGHRHWGAKLPQDPGKCHHQAGLQTL